jgi:nitrite reductase/ring-hydroxylating ferredoxin subunit
VSRFVVGKSGELPPGRSRSVRVDGRRVAIFNQEGRLYAVDEACPHMGADLSNGDLQEGVLTCAWHGWKFRIESGEGLTRSWARLKTHRLVREGEDLVLEISDPPAPCGDIEDSTPPSGEPR